MTRIIPAFQQITDALKEPVYALTRVVAGAFLVPHGLWKLFGITGGTREEMVGFFTSIGLEPAGFLVTAVGTVEFFGGILIALGLLTRPAALAATITTATAALYFHLPLGFYVDTGGVEFSALWAVVLLMVAIKGGGRFSIGPSAANSDRSCYDKDGAATSFAIAVRPRFAIKRRLPGIEGNRAWPSTAQWKLVRQPATTIPSTRKPIVFSSASPNGVRSRS